MSRCEICGTDETELTEVKISGAKMMVCSNCTDMGTKIKKESNDKSTKYSTNNSSDNSSDSSKSTQNYNSEDNNQNSKPDSLDDLSELALNYGDIIRDKRNENGLDRSELAQNLGIKESHLESIENQNTQPSVSLQEKIEKELNVDLSLDDL